MLCSPLTEKKLQKKEEPNTCHIVSLLVDVDLEDRKDKGSQISTKTHSTELRKKGIMRKT